MEVLPVNEEKNINIESWNKKLSSLKTNTKRAFLSDIKKYHTWTGLKIDMPINENQVVGFIDSLIDTGAKLSTIKRSVSSISKMIKVYNSILIDNGLDKIPDTTKHYLVSDKVEGVGIKNQPEKKKVITKKMLCSLAGVCPDSLKGIRDKTLLMVSYRLGKHSLNDIINIKFWDIELIDSVYRVTMNNGFTYVLCRESSSALGEWLSVSGIRSGYIFRSMLNNGSLKMNNITSNTITRIVKELALIHNKKIGGIFSDIDSFSYTSIKHGFNREFAEYKNNFFTTYI